MKKIIVIMSVISVLFLMGCNRNENVDNNSNTNLPSSLENQQTENDVGEYNKKEEQQKIFEDRVSVFYNKLVEISGDRLRENFDNISLSKNSEGSYTLKADLVGDTKISEDALEEAIKEINENNLESIEIETVGNQKVIIYAHKPDKIKAWYEELKKNGNLDPEGGIGTYEDRDWINAKNDDEWLDENNLPMYLRLLSDEETEWAILKKEDGGYYLYERGLAARVELFPVKSINEKDAISLVLLPDDKISLDLFDSDDNYKEDEVRSKIVTVEEYYNIAISENPTDELGNTYDINHMSVFGGLKIENGIIHINARYRGI